MIPDRVRPAFSRAVYAAEFGDGRAIADRDTIAELLGTLGIEPASTLQLAGSDDTKARLKAECARAADIGVIGSPCLVTAGGEAFWGNDRLEQGLDWARERT